MAELKLQICTTDGIAFEGEVISVTARTVVGDVCILKNHANYMTAIDVGMVRIKTEKEVTDGACSGGFLSVHDNVVRIIATTFEFAGDIDAERAKRAKEKAQKKIENSESDKDLKMAEMKLKRALTRINVSQNYKG